MLSYINVYGYEKWVIVISLILLSLFFIAKYIPLKTKFEKRSGGALIVFIAALFTEMYGFPLTIYLLSSFFGINIPLTHGKGHLFGTLLTYLGLGNGWFIVMAISTGLLLLGLYYIVEGWKMVYNAKGKLVTDGIYKKNEASAVYRNLLDYYWIYYSMAHSNYINYVSLSYKNVL